MGSDGRIDEDVEQEELDVAMDLDDDAAWEQAMRDVTPLGDRTEPPPEESPEEAPGTGLAERFRMRQDAAPTGDGDPSFAFDRRTYDRLREERIPIEATLDLHGYTQEEAFSAVTNFLEQAWFEGRRCLLVVTGKGTARDGGGVLRSAVPRWITEGRHSDRLIGIGPADARHGGAGALYVLLRRARDPVV
ncbi:MAG: DNA mismatch repair protein MutS [Deltaproteobacteria bacterium]|nr:DNA mismatch repair protein MutS [Deltaproteobacteria bacterium]